MRLTEIKMKKFEVYPLVDEKQTQGYLVQIGKI